MLATSLNRRTLLQGSFAGAVAVTAWNAPTFLRYAAAKDLTKVAFQLNFNPNAEHAPYFLGKKLGFYEEVSIDIQIKPGQGSAAAAQLVGTGDSAFGVGVADALVVAKSQAIPIISTAVLLQQSPTVLGSKKKQNILVPKDLYGKKVAVSPQSTVYAYWKAFIKVNNLDLSQIEEVSATGATLPLLIADKVDASGLLLTNEVVTLRYEGFEINIIQYSDYGVISYGQTLFANQDFIKKNPDIAAAFTAATLKSWTYALKHTDEAIDALAEAVPETDKKLEALKFPAIIQLSTNKEGTSRFGEQSLEGWTLSYDTFMRGGLIDTPYDPQSLFTTEFSPAASPVASPVAQ